MELLEMAAKFSLIIHCWFIAAHLLSNLPETGQVSRRGELLLFLLFFLQNDGKEMETRETGGQPNFNIIFYLDKLDELEFSNDLSF